MPSLDRASDLAVRLLARVEVRALLSVAIIVSLLPVSLVDTHPWLFFTLFGAELAARVLAALHVETRAEPTPPWRRRLRVAALLGLDFLALLSFVPDATWSDAPVWLREFRLTRLLLLVGYWAPVVRDMRSILAQRERQRQVVMMGFAVAILSFAGAVVLADAGSSGADYDGNGVVDAHDGSFGLRLWWAFRQIQDPGNMLSSPSDVMAVLVSLLLTVSGLFLVSFLIGLATDMVKELLDLSRMRPLGLEGHLIVVHSTPETPRVLRELARHYRKSFTKARAALLGVAPDRPAFLDAPDVRHVAYRSGDPAEADALLRVDSPQARRVVILADPQRADPDAHTTGILLNVRDSNPAALVVAEVLDPRHVSAARVAGGDTTVIVPTEKLLGLVVAAAARRPGVEALLQDLLSTAGREIYTYLYDVPYLPCPRRLLALADDEHLERLYEAGAGDGPGSRVMLLGVLVPPKTGERHFGLRLGTPATLALGPGDTVAGFVGVTENFRVMERFARRHLDAMPPPSAAARPAPPLVPAEGQGELREVVLLGFRPAAVHLAEALMVGEPGVYVQIVVATEVERDEALEMLREHSLHQALGLWQEHGPATRFAELADGTLTCHPDAAGPACGRLRVDVGDWTQDRLLLALPGTGRSVADADLVVVLGGPAPDDDARTAMAVLKIADLVGTGRLPFRPGFRVSGLVVDERLGGLLEARSARTAGGAPGRFRIFSTRELGACFAFQSAVVPGFDAIYSELLSPWGQTFRRLVPAAGGDSGARWSFGALARSLRAEGRALLAVTLREPDGATRLCVAPSAADPGASFEWRDLVDAWVSDEDPAPAVQCLLPTVVPA